MKFPAANFQARILLTATAFVLALFFFGGIAARRAAAQSGVHSQVQPSPQSKAQPKVQSNAQSKSQPKAQSQPENPKPRNPVAQHHQAARTFQLANDFDHAAAEYRQAIAAGLQQLANIEAMRSEYGKAAELLQRAAEAEP